MFDERVLKEFDRLVWIALAHLGKRRVSYRHDLLGEKPVTQLCLCALRIELDLVDSRPDLAVCQHVCQQLNVEVRDADTFCESFLNQALHHWPQPMHGDLDRPNAVMRPMDHVQIYKV